MSWIIILNLFSSSKDPPEATHIGKFLWTYHFLFKCRMLTKNNSATITESLRFYHSIIFCKIKHLPKINQPYIQLRTLLVALEINFFHCWRSWHFLYLIVSFFSTVVLVFNFIKRLCFPYQWAGISVIRTDTPITTLNCLNVCEWEKKVLAHNMFIKCVYNAYFLCYYVHWFWISWIIYFIYFKFFSFTY